MINIYTKVWNRPLLIQEGNQTQQGNATKENNAQYVQESRKVMKESRKNDKSERQRQKFNKEYEEKRRKAVEQPPGQYLIEGDEQQLYNERKEFDG